MSGLAGGGIPEEVGGAFAEGSRPAPAPRCRLSGRIGPGAPRSASQRAGF